MLVLICQCSQKQHDAEGKVDKLCDLVKATLEQNAILNQRLAAVESRDYLRQVSVQPTISKLTTSKESENSPATNWRDTVGENAEPPTWQRNSRGFAFEELLMNSRVYRNAARDSSDAFSIITSAGRTASWSMLSGLSLSEISHIAILALPIYAADITNKEAYDFNPPTTEETGLLNQQTDTATDAKAKGSRRRWLRTFLSRDTRSPTGQEQAFIASNERRIFGVALSTSITYANIAISLVDENGQSYIYNYIPIVIAKCGVHFKEKGKLPCLYLSSTPIA